MTLANDENDDNAEIFQRWTANVSKEERRSNRLKINEGVKKQPSRQRQGKGKTIIKDCRKACPSVWMISSTKTWSSHDLSQKVCSFLATLTCDLLVVSDRSTHQQENETTAALFLSAQLLAVVSLVLRTLLDYRRWRSRMCRNVYCACA